MDEHTPLLKQIQSQFRTFGGGRATANNPMAHALKDEPLQFAACVNVADVVRVVLDVSGHDELVEACRQVMSAIGHAEIQVHSEEQALVPALNQLRAVLKKAALAKAKE